MKLNHLNLAVTDVPAAEDFLEKYFDMRRLGGNAGMALLTDEGGFVLTLMKASRATELKYPANFHIGFGQENEAQVNALHARLAADGFIAPAPSREHAWTFYIEAPGGITIEVLSP
jgi:lactoylglutathione lyase